MSVVHVYGTKAKNARIPSRYDNEMPNSTLSEMIELLSLMLLITYNPYAIATIYNDISSQNSRYFFKKISITLADHEEAANCIAIRLKLTTTAIIAASHCTRALSIYLALSGNIPEKEKLVVKDYTVGIKYVRFICYPTRDSNGEKRAKA